MQLDSPEKDLRSFALQEYSTGGGEDLASFVNSLAVDQDSDAVASADAFDTRPLAVRTLHVALASKTRNVLPRRVLVHPSYCRVTEDLPGGLGIILILRIIGRNMTLSDGHSGPHGDGAAIRVSALDEQKVAEAPFHYLALDSRLVCPAANVVASVAPPRSPPAIITGSIGPHAVQEYA